MQTESRSQAWWFAVALVTTMVVCLCLAVGLVGTGWISKAISESFSPPSASRSTPTPVIVASPTPGFDLSTSPVGDALLAETSLEEISNTFVPDNDPISLTKRLKGIADIPQVLSTEYTPIPLGTVETFWANDNDANRNFQVDAELVYATEHVYFWVEVGVEFELSDVVALVDDFETNTYPTNREFFGSEWTPGVDGDPHLYMLYARGLGWSVAGLYGPNDEYSPEAHEFSNSHEMFYISADNAFLWEDYTYGILAHEFQHMIHWYRDSNEDTWLNEGFSELAVLLNGHDIGGFDWAYSNEPDQTLSFWPSSGESSTHYGQGFLFVTYFLDRFGSEVTQALISNPANGLDSIDQTLETQAITDPQSGEKVTADDVYADWAAALWLNDREVGDGRYAYQSYDPPRPSTSDQIESCPSGAVERQVGQYGLDYIRIECQGDHTMSFQGESLVAVVPGEPHSGSYAMWSNRGDTSDMTLTRSFDFTNVDGALEFDYWVWYDIELDWDYVYLEASLDGGENWEILRTPSSTDTNPSGNSFGWGYTGFSGGGSAAEWIQETVDLSAYNGKNVLLRFEYITDAAVNGEGFVVDDLTIEAIGYSEDFEDGLGGWEPGGFVRLYNRLPQTYRLMLIEEGDETRVREIALDVEQHAEIQLSLGDVYDEAILVVIGTTRHTWQPAPYRFQVIP
jgi:immune inhibitor A